MLGMAGYTGWQIWKAVDAAAHPATIFENQLTSTVISPGLILCAPDAPGDHNSGFFFEPSIACRVNDRGINYQDCPEFSAVNYTYASLIRDTRRCLDLKPGAIFRNKQTIIQITWAYVNPDIVEPIQYRGLYAWDALFYGFYTSPEDRATAEVTQGSIIGSTLVSFTRKTYTDVESKVVHSVDVDSVSFASATRALSKGRNLTVLGLPEKLPGDQGATWYYGSFILIPNDMLIRTVKEEIQWTWLDVLSAIGGFYAIIGSFLVAFHGEAYFRNPGLLRKIFYGVPPTESGGGNSGSHVAMTEHTNTSSENDDTNASNPSNHSITGDSEASRRQTTS